MVSMLGAMVTVCAGLALFFQLRGERRCAITWIGDGGTSTGALPLKYTTATRVLATGRRTR